jgi:hypothetical protein
MTPGSLTNHGMMWTKNLYANRFAKWLTGGAMYITAFRCPNCFKVELVSEEK